MALGVGFEPPLIPATLGLAAPKPLSPSINSRRPVSLFTNAIK